MADSIVRDFLVDCKTVTDAEIHSFASTLRENNELIDAIILVLEEKEYHHEFLEPLCEQLFAFFNSTEDALSQFAHFFLPCVLGVYFSSLHKKERKALRCLEILLLGAYNLQILDNEGKPTTNTYGIPSMSKPSIYHEVCVSTGSLFSHRDTHAVRAAGRLPLRSVILFRQHHHGTVTKVTAVASRLAPHCHHHR